MAIQREINYVLNLQDKASKGLADFTKAAAASAAVLAAVGATVKSAMDFESSFAGIRKTVDATEMEFASLAQGIRQMSKETPIAVNELNNIGEMAGQLGVSGVENLEKFIETVAKISVSTNLTSDAAATSFARIANIMSEPIENVDRMASSVVDLGNNFATTESEIVEFATRIAGSAKIAQVSTPDIFAIGAAMSSVGVQAEMGGTAVQKVMIELQKQGKTGIGAFTEFVDELAEAGDGAVQMLEDMGLADQRLIRAFLSLANAGDLLDRSLATSGAAFEKNTALSIEAAKRYATTASQMIIMKNNINDVSISLGSTLLPIINELLTKHIVPLIQKMGAWVEAHPELTKWILLTATAIAGLIAVIFAAGFVIIGISAALSSLALVFNPVTIAIAAFVAGITAMVFAVRLQFEQFSSFFTILWDNVKLMLGEALAFIVALITLDFGKIFEILVKFGQNFFIIFSDVWAKAQMLTSVGTDYISSIITKFAAVIVDTLMSALDVVRAAFESVFTWIADKLSGILSQISSAVSTVASLVGRSAGRSRATGGVISENFTMVGENGPELISAPNGSRIRTNAETQRMMGGGGPSVNITVQGSLIGLSKQELADTIGQQIMRSLNPLLNNV